MAMKLPLLVALAGLGAPWGAEARHLRKPQGLTMSVLPMHTYRHDCGRKHPVSLVAAKVSTRIPGAGMEPNLIVPFETVLKDSFFKVDCVADFMFTHGDKFGDAKHEYLLAGVANVSIVHYDAHVAKEDRQEMTHEVCFSFCRTVPDMNYFGIKNGRDCYCMTFYQAMAEDDESMCDEVCDGDPVIMCGGKTKSSIFGMHACGNTAEQLKTTKGKVSEMGKEMMGLKSSVSDLSAGMQEMAAEWQKMLGDAGDPGASDLMQTAKVFAGELEHAASDADKLSKTMQSLAETAKGMKDADLTDAAQMKDAEGVLEAMEEAITQGAATTEELESLLAQASPNITGQGNTSQRYYPIMYFVDKTYSAEPTTCTGTAAEKPMVGSMDQCARACDADVQECVGFSFFPGTGDDEENGLCFMMSKVETVKFWAGCSSDEATPEQVQSDGPGGPAIGPPQHVIDAHKPSTPTVDASQVKCMVKLAEFEGDSLKPNPSGKCDICLEEAAKIDRCFV